MKIKPEIDLAWASQKIPGFEEMMRKTQENKAAEQAYRDRFAKEMQHASAR